MTLTLTCRGLRSVTEAVISIGTGLTLVVGSNGAGKSSCATAAAALLTRDGKLGRTKEDRARGLVGDQARAASVTLAGPAGEVRITWPEGEVVQRGDAPQASRIAAGLDRPAAVDAKARAAMLLASLKAEPAEQEWLAACAEEPSDAGPVVPATVATQAWKRIARDGWDAAVKALSDEGRDAKAIWRRIASASSYPSKGAAQWQPAGYEHEDLTLIAVETAEADLAEARAARDTMLKAAAVGAAERERLQGLTGQMPDLEALVLEADAAVGAAQAKVDSWDAKLQRITVARSLCPCPHCDEPVEIWPEQDPGGPPLRKPSRAASVDPATLADWRRAQTEARGALAAAQQAQQDAGRRLAEAQQARDTLSGLPPLDAHAMEQVERAVTKAEARARAVKATHEAREQHDRIVALAAAVTLAGPAGLRQKKMAETRDLLNGGLATLCAAAGWSVVNLGPELEVRYGGRLYEDLSESERWRAEAALAIEIGRRDGSELIVLDRADVLLGRPRNGLLSMARQTGLPIIVFMTDLKTKAAQIAGAGFDVWLLDGGTAVPAQVERAAA